MTDEPFKPHADTPTLLQEALSESARLTDSHYAAIGRVAANWSYFEAIIDTETINLSGVKTAAGVCFTAQIMGSRAKLDAFISLVRHMGAELKYLDQLEKLSKATLVLSERRNRAVHDVWILDDPENPTRLEATARKVVRLIKIPVPTESLIKLAVEIEANTERFAEISGPIMVLLGALRDKPRPTPHP